VDELENLSQVIVESSEVLGFQALEDHVEHLPSSEDDQSHLEAGNKTFNTN